jgi:hypothetical protein
MRERQREAERGREREMHQVNHSFVPSLTKSTATSERNCIGDDHGRLSRMNDAAADGGGNHRRHRCP